MKKTININDLNDTKELASKLANLIESGTVILLSGDLGAGKTTFTQALGKFLGVKRVMTSPTFNIIKSYNLPKFKVHHMDCYRLEDSDEDLGFEEYFNNEDITIIEWYNFIEEYLPDEYLKIHIEHITTDKRRFTLCSKGEVYDRIVGEL